MLISPSCPWRFRYYFLGRLLGVAFRCQIPLDLSLSTEFWLRLSGFTPCLDDLIPIDDSLRRLKHLQECLRAYESDRDNKLMITKVEEALSAAGAHNFTYVLSDGTLISLLDGQPVHSGDINSTGDSGSDRGFGGGIDPDPAADKMIERGGYHELVTLENADVWVRLVIERRLNETSEQMQSLLNGLATVIPLHVFSLFQPKEIESLFCGAADFDVDVRLLYINI